MSDPDHDQTASARSRPAAEALRGVLRDAFIRIREHVEEVTAGLSSELLRWRPAPDANPIGWLVWHAARVQDDHVAHLAGTAQVWTREGWYDRFALPYPQAAHGYGHNSAEVGQFHATAELLDGYQAQVHEMVLAYLATITEGELARVVDTSWDPPVTAGVRLVSVIDDCAQHLGQAAYLRGVATSGQWRYSEG